MPFLIKYDTGGDVLWCNQIYTQGDNSQSASAGWTGSSVNAGSVFVLGNGAYNESENGLVYFDNENNPLQRFQQNSLYQTFLFDMMRKQASISTTESCLNNMWHVAKYHPP